MPANPSKSQKPPTRTHDIDYMGLPFRVPRDQVALMDEAWKWLGLKSRSDLFRRSISVSLGDNGEEEIAAAFSADVHK